MKHQCPKFDSHAPVVMKEQGVYDDPCDDCHAALYSGTDREREKVEKRMKAETKRRDKASKARAEKDAHQKAVAHAKRKSRPSANHTTPTKFTVDVDLSLLEKYDEVVQEVRQAAEMQVDGSA